MQKSVQPQTTNNSNGRDAAVQISEAVKNHRISKDMEPKVLALEPYQQKALEPASRLDSNGSLLGCVLVNEFRAGFAGPDPSRKRDPSGPCEFRPSRTQPTRRIARRAFISA